MRKYIVWGLGFGDNENAYELVGSYKTLQEAQAEVDAIIADSTDKEFMQHCLRIEIS